MKMYTQKGFTLVEILIVVVIIALLAIMAVPAFQKVSESSRESSLISDARLLGAAAQGYLLDEEIDAVPHGYNPEDGSLGEPLQDHQSQIGTDYDIQPVELSIDQPFTISHPRLSDGAPYTFNPDGTLLSKPGAEEAY